MLEGLLAGKVGGSHVGSPNCRQQKVFDWISVVAMQRAGEQERTDQYGQSGQDSRTRRVCMLCSCEIDTASDPKSAYSNMPDHGG